MGDEMQPPPLPPMPIWAQLLRNDLKRVAQAIGDLALGLHAKSQTDTRHYEEMQGMLLAILVEGRKIEVKPERARRDSGDEHSDVFKVPTLPGVQVGMTRKAQREMLARIGKLCLLAILFLLTHIVAYFKLPHPEVVSPPVIMPAPAPPPLAPSISVPALKPPVAPSGAAPR